MFGTPLRVPGVCFASSPRCISTPEQLEFAKANVKSFAPAAMDSNKFRHSLFVPRDLKKARLMYIKDNALARPDLSPRYTGPYEVLEKNWEKSNFKIKLPRGPDNIALSWLKAASTVPPSLGEVCCSDFYSSND